MKMRSLYLSLARHASTRLKTKISPSQSEDMLQAEGGAQKRSGLSSSSSSSSSSTLSPEDDELVAPEGGWGYIVGIGFSLLFIVVVGPMTTFGVIFKDFFEVNGYGTSGMTLVHGIQNAVVSFTGFITTNGLKRFTMRQVGLFGSFVFILGASLTVFTTSVPYLIFSSGLLQGIGLGVMIPICLTSFNNYFVEKRVAMMGLTSVIVGVGFMVFPGLIKFFMENYGFRGTLAMMSALSLHTILAMLVMQPVEWHLVPRIKKHKKITPVSHNYYSDISLTMEKVINEKPTVLSNLMTINENVKEDEVMETKEPLLIQTMVEKMHQFQPTIGDVEKRSSLVYNPYYGEHNEFDENYSSNLAKASSLSSLGNWTSAVLATEAVPTKSGAWQTLVNSFDFSLMKDAKYCNICFGVSFAFFAEITFFVLEPMLLYHYGFSEAEVAMCITAGAATDLVFRVIIALYTFYFRVNSRTVFFIGTCCITILRIVFMQYRDFFHILILTGCLGVFRSWLHVFLPLVFAENCTNENFPTAYGLFMMVSGIITLALSVLVGFIRDYTMSYTVAFHFLTGCFLVLIVPWIAEFYFTHRNKKNSTNEIK